MALAREARCNAEAGEPDPPSCGVYEHVGGLDVLMDEPASVELIECARQGHGESEKLSDLHGLADEAIEGLASFVIDNEHRLPAFAHELQWPQCPRAVQVLAQFEFMCEAIDALKDRMLGVGKDGYERVPPAVGIIPRQSTEGASRISPQHLQPSRSPNQPRTRRMPSSFRLLVQFDSR